MMLMTAPAWATANVSCLIDDAYLRFELEAIAGRDGPITQVQVGKVQIKPAAAVKLLSSQITFDRSHIIQQWLLGDDMRLQVEVSDDTAKATIILVIVASLKEKQDKYFGHYVLKISRAGETKELKGRIKQCEAG
jgi:hypothetical protein